MGSAAGPSTLCSVISYLQKIATLWWHQVIGSRGDLHVECASNDCWVGLGRVEFLQQEWLWTEQQGHPPSAVLPVLQKIATLWHQVIGSRGDLHVECASNDCWVGWCMG